MKEPERGTEIQAALVDDAAQMRELLEDVAGQTLRFPAGAQMELIEASPAARQIFANADADISRAVLSPWVDGERKQNPIDDLRQIISSARTVPREFSVEGQRILTASHEPASPLEAVNQAMGDRARGGALLAGGVIECPQCSARLSRVAAQGKPIEIGGVVICVCDAALRILEEGVEVIDTKTCPLPEFRAIMDGREQMKRARRQLKAQQARNREAARRGSR